jgi:hypothetical protein
MGRDALLVGRTARLHQLDSMGDAMSPLTTETDLSKQYVRHRHTWYVIRRFKTGTGREKELLGCRCCKAEKGRFVKVLT